MSKFKDDSELAVHKNETISKIDNFINNLIENSECDEKNIFELKKKADLICYWLSDYVDFLEEERDFDPTKLKRYKRGEIIKVHLGFRIGSEEKVDYIMPLYLTTITVCRRQY